MTAPVVPLTATQLRVLELMAEGDTVAEIGAKLYISPGTIKGHMREIYQRLGARNAQHAVHVGHQLGLLESERTP